MLQPPVVRAQRDKFETPAHLDTAQPEPLTDVSTLRTKGDLMGALGDWVTWGRTVAAQFSELRRPIDVFNGQAKETAPAAHFGGPK